MKSMIVTPVKTKIFKERQNLLQFVDSYCSDLKEKSIVVVTSKIVALAEGRTAIINNATTKESLIRSESAVVIPTKHVFLTIKDGMAMPSAGIDESNANGKLILLPKDSFNSARMIRNYLRRKQHIKQLGVLITDSRTVPLRAGVTGVALGYAGFKGLRDYRNQPDIFGRKFKFSYTNVADSLATAAVLMMGEGNEQCPLSIIENAPVVFCKKINRQELIIPPEDDMYRPLFINLKGS